MLTITEIKKDKKSGLRQFEIVDHDRTEKTVTIKGKDGAEDQIVDMETVIVLEGAYKTGVTEDGTPVMKPVIFLPKGNSVNQIGVALSKFDAKTKDLEVKTIEIGYRESHQRNTTSAPSSSKLDKFATAEEKAELAEMEQYVEGQVGRTATEKEIDLYKFQLAEYNLEQARAKRDGVECTAVKPRNPQASTGSFIELLDEARYARYQEIVKACDERKATAPKASRKLDDATKVERREKAIEQRKADFLAKYGVAPEELA